MDIPGMARSGLQIVALSFSWAVGTVSWLTFSGSGAAIWFGLMFPVTLALCYLAERRFTRS